MEVKRKTKVQLKYNHIVFHYEIKFSSFFVVKVIINILDSEKLLNEKKTKLFKLQYGGLWLCVLRLFIANGNVKEKELIESTKSKKEN